MEASKVEILPRTLMQANGGKLVGKKKAKLRERLIVEYIEQNSGRHILGTEFMRIGGWNQESLANRFVRELVAKGKVEREDTGYKRFLYSVPKHGKVRIVRDKVTLYSAEQVEALAKDFAWEHAEGQNDLRTFIAWVKELE